jgi:hypothetical protein
MIGRARFATTSAHSSQRRSGHPIVHGKLIRRIDLRATFRTIPNGDSGPTIATKSPETAVRTIPGDRRGTGRKWNIAACQAQIPPLLVS